MVKIQLFEADGYPLVVRDIVPLFINDAIVKGRKKRRRGDAKEEGSEVVSREAARDARTELAPGSATS